jgi:ABC-type polysaccharide/polyol phosphate transport system ATPase subunit
MQKIIIASNITKRFRIGFKDNQSVLAMFISFFSGREHKKDLEALSNVAFELNSGEILGIIGSNGCGKSTLLRIIAGIYSPSSGKIILNGKIISLINLNAGLKERLTLKDNVFLCGSLFGLSQNEIKSKFNSIVEFSELHDYINTKIYQFSEGMKQRLAFSIAIHCNPEILVLDEVFEVGDEEFRHKSGKKIIEMVKNGCSVILVSHGLEMVKKYCDRVILMDKGKIIKDGNPEEIVREYII